MAKITIYKCDGCKRPLSDRAAGREHLSLAFAEASGRVSLDTPLTGWRYKRLIGPGLYHFCDPSCLAAWTTAVLYAADPPPNYVSEPNRIDWPELETAPRVPWGEVFTR